MLSLIVLAYNLSSIPYFLAFQVDVVESVWLRTFEDISVVFWSVDLFMNFRTGYYENGCLHMDPAGIARHYLRSSFILDISTLTVDIIALVFRVMQLNSASGGTPVQFIRVLKTWRIVRLVGILRMLTISRHMDRIFLLQSTQLKGLARSAFNVLQFVLVLMWINHVIACMWCFLGHATSPDTDFTWMDLSTGSLEGSYSQLGQTYQYLSAMHWALTQMTPGSMQVFPVNSNERVFNIFCLLCGLLVFSTLVSSISANVAQIKMQMQASREEMEKLDRFLERSQIEPDLRMQVTKQVKVRLLYRRPQVVKDMGMLENLSMPLRSELQLALCNPHFLDHPLLHFLSTFDRRLWAEVCFDCVDFTVLAATDTLFIFHAQADGMHFVARGALQYTVDASFQGSHGKPSEKVGPGDWLSEAALWCQWRHVGCAEVRSATAPCEVLLLKAAELIPTLKRGSGLVEQVFWAYARSFHSFLQQCMPPHFDFPNDLVVPFRADEAIAAMPTQAKVVLGRESIKVLMAPPETLFATWLSQIRQGSTIDKLAADVQRGGSALLVTAKEGVVRTVPLVVIRLQREDKRIFVRLRQTESADGGMHATCELPGAKQEPGEHPVKCLNRLLQGKLQALADGITVTEVERQSEQNQSKSFGVPTRYVRTKVSAKWLHTADEPLQRFRVDGVALSMSEEADQHAAWWQMAAHASDGHSRANHRRGSMESPGSRLSCDREVFAFPTDSDFYAWLTDLELRFFSSPQGQPILLRWLSALSQEVEASRNGEGEALVRADPAGEGVAVDGVVERCLGDHIAE